MTTADPFVGYDGIYLLSHSVGLPVTDAQRSVDDYFDAWAHDPVEAWPRWLDTVHGFRRALGRLIGGEPAGICPQSNVSSGLTKILGSISHLFAARSPTILLTEDAFPSLAFACEHAGYDVRFIGRDVDALDPETWNQHMTSDVDAVLITHVHSNTGELIPAHDIIDLARVRRVISIVDVAQSVGIVPIDVAELGADFVVGSCVKWLSGGPGAGWIWVHPAMIERCEPSDVGWFSHADPFEFDIRHFRYADDALRFWGGSPTILPFAVARNSIDVIERIGVDSIRQHNLDLTDRLFEGLGDRVVSPHDRDLRSGTAIVTGTAQLAGTLIAHGVAVDHRAPGIRMSPHVHTDRDDIDAVVALLGQLSARSLGG